MIRRLWTALLLALVAVPTQAQTPESARPLSLEEALALAHPASEAVALARVAVERSRGQLMQARSALFPQITGSASYTRQIKSQFDNVLSSSTPDTSTVTAPASCDAFTPDPNTPLDQRLAALEQAVECTTTVNPFAGFSRLPFGRKNTYNLGLSGSQVLFDGGQIFGRMKAADAARRSAEIGVTSAEAKLILDVVEAYYDAALTSRLATISQATLSQADTTLHQTQLREQVGNAPEFDVLRARVARDNQRTQLIQAEAQRDLADVRLKQLLDLPLDRPLALTTELGDTSFASTPTLAEAASATPDTAATDRAAVRQAGEAIRAQEGLDAASRAQRFPSISLTSQYSRIGYPSRGLPSWNEFVTDWRLSLGVQVPIFTGGRISGDRVAAKAALAQARLQRQQTAKAAQLDARNSLAQLRAAEAAWVASEGTEAQANRAYQIADLRFREGISTQTELLDARIALQQAQVNRARAARDLQVARVRMALLPDLPLAGASSMATEAGASTAPTTSTTAAPQQPATGGQTFP